jgi:hypothetical protein
VIPRAEREDALQPVAPLVDRPPHAPKERQRVSQSRAQFGIVLLDRPAEGRPQVVALRLQPVQGRRDVRPPIRGGDQLREREVDVGVPPPRGKLFAAGRQLLLRELAHGFQHPEARLAPPLLRLAQQARVHQRCHPVQHVGRAAAARAANPLRRVQREAANEDGQAAEEGLLLRRQVVVTPGDGVPHRLLPSRQVPPAAGQQRQPLLQPGEEGGGRQDLDPGGGELDGQRQPVEPAADVGDGRGVGLREGEVGPDRLRAVDEEADGLDRPQLRQRLVRTGVGDRQRPDLDHPFAGEPQRGTAGGKRRHPGAAGEDPRD